MLGDSGIGVAAGLMTFFILIFGEIVPKTFAAQNAEKLALIVARPIELISLILTPFIWFFEHISSYIAKALGTKNEKTLSEEEIKVIVSIGKEEGILSPEVAKLMHNVLEFEKIRVNKIMTPRKQMSFVDGNSTLEDSIDYFIKTDYSKYPVYLEHENCIAGVLYIDDLLRFVKTKNLSVKIKDIATNAYFVPENKEIDELLIEFEQKEIEIAIVVDEYGDISGMVTTEDIIDEIVGDIFNKAKAESVYIKHIDEKSTQVEAIAPIKEVNHVLKLDIKEEHFNTIAGFLIGKLGRIPKQGEQIKFHKATIEVEEVTDQEIKSVKIIKH
jgi:CBS domain containing-hemolysin-like protein